MTRDNRTATALSFIVGACIGAAAALFFAPKTGENLRADVAEGMSNAIDHVRTTGKDLKKHAQKLANDAKEHVQDALEAGDQAYGQAKKS